MLRPFGHFGAGTVLAALLLAPLSNAREEKVPVNQVPGPVMETVKARFADARVTGAGRETEKGQLVYEVTIVEDGREVDVTLSPAGEMLMIEKTIDLAGLPTPATKALEERYPAATYRIVEEIVEVEKKQERLAYYEVLLVTSDRRTIEVQVTPDGTSVNEEKEEEEVGGEEESEDREDNE